MVQKYLKFRAHFITQLFGDAVLHSVVRTFSYTFYYFCQFWRQSFCCQLMPVQNAVRNSDVWYTSTPKPDCRTSMAGDPSEQNAETKFHEKIVVSEEVIHEFIHIDCNSCCCCKRLTNINLPLSRRFSYSERIQQAGLDGKHRWSRRVGGWIWENLASPAFPSMIFAIFSAAGFTSVSLMVCGLPCFAIRYATSYDAMRLGLSRTGGVALSSNLTLFTFRKCFFSFAGSTLELLNLALQFMHRGRWIASRSFIHVNPYCTYSSNHFYFLLDNSRGTHFVIGEQALSLLMVSHHKLYNYKGTESHQPILDI